MYIVIKARVKNKHRQYEEVALSKDDIESAICAKAKRMGIKPAKIQFFIDETKHDREDFDVTLVSVITEGSRF
jgi:hypothetical protein